MRLTYGSFKKIVEGAEDVYDRDPLWDMVIDDVVKTFKDETDNFYEHHKDEVRWNNQVQSACIDIRNRILDILSDAAVKLHAGEYDE